MALIMTVYNMKRAINILGIEKLLEKLKNWKPKYPKGLVSKIKESILSLYARFSIFNYKYIAWKQSALQRLKSKIKQSFLMDNYENVGFFTDWLSNIRAVVNFKPQLSDKTDFD